jgi:hypothetical protein
LGTAVIDERIIPVPYSPDTSRTARVPRASWAKIVPIPPRLATSAGTAEDVFSAAATAEMATPIPTIRAVEVAIVHQDERNERNFVHSERTRRGAVTGPATGEIAGMIVDVAVIGLPPRMWRRRTQRWPGWPA